MISYYLLVAVVDVLTAVNEDDWQIAADIREGNISQFLLKPVDYLWYPALPVFFRAHRVHGGGAGAAGHFHCLFRALFCPAGERHGLPRVSAFRWC